MKRVTLETCTKDELIKLIHYISHSYPDRDFYVIRGLNHIQESRFRVLLEKIEKHESVVKQTWQKYIDALKIAEDWPSDSAYQRLKEAKAQAEKADREHERLLKQLEEDGEG